MERISCFLTCCFLALKIIGQDATKDINVVFDGYKSAIVNDNGAAAVEFMDTRTLDYYKKLLNYVLTADSVTLESLPLMDKFSVLSVRHMATKKEILAFTDKSFIAFTIKKGMMGKNTLEGYTLGKVTVKDNFAKAQIIADGEKSDKYYHFYSDGTKWKIDITPLFAIEEKETEDFIKQSGKPENEFIFGILELMTEKTPSPAIWKKIK
jgi:hypothetical protein